MDECKPLETSRLGVEGDLVPVVTDLPPAPDPLLHVILYAARTTLCVILSFNAGAQGAQTQSWVMPLTMRMMMSSCAFVDGETKSKIILIK